MSINIIAILLSFAMMLTGVGGEGQPAEGSRTMILHNLSIHYNGMDLELNPALQLGASTDGEKAVFDLGVLLDDETLFPIQLGVSEDGITALFKNSDVAAKISADALNGLTEQANAMLESMTTGDDESSEMMGFIMNEYIPAYTGLLDAIQDEVFLADMEKTGNALFAQIVDRGEGTPVTETVDGAEYALNQYNYTIDGDTMAELSDAIYASNEVLNNYYQALFKLYDMMPEESGLNGMHSFKDMFDKFNLSMTMEIEEKLSDDEEVDIMDAVLTIDLSGMIQMMAEADGDTADLPPFDALPIEIHSEKVGVKKDATARCQIEFEGGAMDMDVRANSDEDGDMRLMMNMRVDGEDDNTVAMDMLLSTGHAGGGDTYNADCHFSTPEASLSFLAHGFDHPKGMGDHTFQLEAYGEGLDLSVGFEVELQSDAIEDLANGHEAAVVLDDLSEESLSALMQDESVQGAMMQVMGSLSMDSQKLMADESVQSIMALMQPAATETDYDYTDGSFEGEDSTGDTEDYDYDYTEPEDDGELGFEVPEFTWLPDGWTVQNTDVDTAYDWVNISLSNDDGTGFAYASFYADSDNTTINYLVGEDGSVEAVDGREMSLTDYGDGNVSISLREGGLWGNLSFLSNDLDVETIGQIVAGLKF